MASRPRRPDYSRRAQWGQFAGYVILVAGGMVGAILLALAVFDQRTFGAVRAATAEITTPISSLLATAERGLAAIPQGIADFFAVKARNAALRDQLMRDRAKTLEARALVHENARLRMMLGLRQRAPDTITTGHLVSSSASSTRRFAVIDAGWRQRVAVGQPVREAMGLVGRIVEVGPDSARVLLITDPESIVPVRRESDGLPAIAAGRGDGFVEIRAVSAGSGVFRAGDTFSTSGVGGIYTPGIPVARALRNGRDTVIGRGFAQPDAFDFAIVERAFAPAAITGPQRP